jgi:hypothetical protein
MVNTPSTPPPTGPVPSQGAKSADDQIDVPGKGFEAKPLTFLGMHFDSKEATKLWQVIIQMVNREIEKDKEKAVKAIRDFRQKSEGED